MPEVIEMSTLIVGEILAIFPSSKESRDGMGFLKPTNMSMGNEVFVSIVHRFLSIWQVEMPPRRGIKNDDALSHGKLSVIITSRMSLE
jgi:hypothetical protein